jgi:NitT/TauT family transport system ATP-binding protein
MPDNVTAAIAGADRGPAGSGDASWALEVRDVTKVHESELSRIRALESLSFDLRAGEFLSVVGPSGCGKSTMLHLLAGLTLPTSGSVVIDGAEVRAPYSECGIVFQEPVLLEWRSILDNVLLQFVMRGQDPAPHRERALALLRSLGLEGAAGLYPRHLSGGMRQRVAIARALIHQPPLLLMDEPFSAVDAFTREQLAVDLQRLWMESGGDVTVVFVTHQIDEAVFLGDRVMVMTPHPGRIAQMVDIPIPRPRRLQDIGRGRHAELNAAIRDVFLRTGVLRGEAPESET